MACQKCGKEYGDIVMCTITDAVGHKAFCPNCLALSFYLNELSFLNDPSKVDDITGKPGAVEFVSYGERYVLERRTMMRLISFNLKKSEWLALSGKYGTDKYMLHDDFYAEDGTALQPIR